jgi:ATP phosphoribosyltransferase
VKIYFDYEEQSLEGGRLLCKVAALGEEVEFVIRNGDSTYFRKQAEAHILIKRLRVLFHQRQIAYQIMEVNDERMEVLQRLIAQVNALTLVKFNLLYELILENKEELLMICPKNRGPFNTYMEQIIIHAIMEVEQEKS